MRWRNFVRVSGFIGASVCGVCVVKAYSKSGWICGTVSAAGKKCDHQCWSTEDPLGLLGGLTLRQVHVFFRHGARTPLNITPGIEEVAYPMGLALRTVPHTLFKYQVAYIPDFSLKNETSELEQHYQKTQLKGGGYAGILTTYGQQQMYSLGVQLREQYVHKFKLLSPNYTCRNVYIQSTDTDRTINSACCVLAGLFTKENLSKHGPITIPVLRADDEFLYPNSKVCNVLKKANHAAMVHCDHIPGISLDRQLVECALGYDPDGPHRVNFISLRDDLIARVTHGYLVPEPLQPYMAMIDYNATKMVYFAMTGQHDAERPIVTRLSAGPAMNKVMEEVKKLSTGENTRKIYLYSTHDSLMVALLECLGLFDWKWPPFAADLRIELFEDDFDKEMWIRILYCGREKVLRGCGTYLCTLQDFTDVVQPYLISRGPDFDMICNSLVLERIAASLLLHDKGEVETEKIKETSEIPAGM